METIEAYENQQDFIERKILSWESEIERAGGIELWNCTDHSEKLRLINRNINEILQQAESFTNGESAFIFMGLSDLDCLMRLRHITKVKIMEVLEPEMGHVSTQDIERARSVPLYRLMQGIKKNTFILCPYHDEKTPSFKVGDFGYCFGCGAHADSIQWCIDIFKMNFAEAIRHLATL